MAGDEVRKEEKEMLGRNLVKLKATIGILALILKSFE